MIVKSLTRTAKSFGQLLRYINQPEKKGERAILHNLRTSGDDLPEIRNEFLKNGLAVPVRANGIMLYHEIISLSSQDRELVTEEILEDLALKYLEMRAPHVLAYGKAHFNTATPHIHLMLSSNLIESSKKHRLSKSKFKRIKKELEIYQKERYPFLVHSLAFEGKKQEKEKLSLPRAEQERSRRLEKEGKKKRSQKELVGDKVRDSLNGVNSEKEFLTGLKKTGYEFYARGETVGVKNRVTGRKYRLKSLGLGAEYEEARGMWARVPRQVAELERVREREGRERERERGRKG